jgi:hypothetical protein
LGLLPGQLNDAIGPALAFILDVDRLLDDIANLSLGFDQFDGDDERRCLPFEIGAEFLGFFQGGTPAVAGRECASDRGSEIGAQSRQVRKGLDLLVDLV